jgi:hypothetical protein
MRLATVVMGVLAAFAAPLDGPAGSRRAPSEPTAWDRDGAAKYLDERIEVWFVKGKKLQTGEARTVCVSCHTSLPYALARPALRRSMHVSEATPQEARLLDEARRRVESYDAHQPLYDSSESKKTESRGTEAVLNAVLLATADAAAGRKHPSEATGKALARMWQTQRPDGAWDWLLFGLEPFETSDAVYYGAALAAFAAGTAHSTPDAGARSGMDRLRRYLDEKYAEQRLLNRVWLLLASTRFQGLLGKARREALVEEIQGMQREDGGWSLQTLGSWRWDKTAAPFAPPGKVDAALLAGSDGYATGLVVYTLRQAGLPARAPAVARGLGWLRANQQPVPVEESTLPAWRSHSLNFDREHGGDKGEPWRRMFMSDSATAFAVLALAASE